MDYVHYEESIALKYGRVIGSSTPVLTVLHDALRDGKCEWVKLQPMALKARKAKWDTDVAAGWIVARARNPRSDIGKKRKAADLDDNGNDVDSSTEGDAAPTAQQSPIIEEPGTSTTTMSTAAPAGPMPKHRKTVPKATAAIPAKKPRANVVPRRAEKENTPARRGGKGPRDDCRDTGGTSKGEDTTMTTTTAQCPATPASSNATSSDATPSVPAILPATIDPALNLVA
ncbi:hypothetical protein C8J57DRAFT_1215791 [Mycena rebaudengoi]|nr:hypothetical protein C8J57DRAFT_1215791 [Mycena rebaudengoi]